MRKINLRDILIICSVTLGLITGKVSAEEIILPITGGVYYMISSPVLPEDPDPQVSLVDNLGFYNKTRWRFFRHEPTREGYVELKGLYWDPIKHDFDFGRGYWIISRNSTEIDIEGTLVVENEIILEHRGDRWNQIGNIFDYDFPLAGLYVARDSNRSDQKQLIDPVNNDLTYITLQEFENGSYIDIPSDGNNSLEVGKGYWLRVNEGVDEPIVLFFVVMGPSALSKEIHLSDEFFERIAQQDDPPDPPPAIESSYSVSFGGGSGSGGGGCFIATAAYGKYNHPSVQILRGLRDRYLLGSSFGRVFVNMYYRYSPTLARFVGKYTPTRALVRFTLVPVIGISALISKMNANGFLMVLAFPFLGSLLFLKWRRGVWGRCKAKFSRKSKEGRRRK